MLNLLASPTTNKIFLVLWYDRVSHVLITGAEGGQNGICGFSCGFVVAWRYGFDTF
jgi:hypothetical protein